MLVDCDDGAVVIAGQAVETAEEFRDAIERPSEHGDCAANVQKLLDLAPLRVYFSHDDAWWESAVAP